MSGANSSEDLKNPKLMFDVEQAHGSSNASHIKKQGPSVFTIIAMTVLALLSISGFIMAAWSTAELHKVRDDLDEARERGVFTTLKQARRHGEGTAMSVFSGSGYWFSGPDMEFPRADHVAVSNGSHIFVLGGTSDDDNDDVIVLNRTVAYNIYKQSAVVMADMPTPRHRFNAVLLGDKIYVFAGLHSAESVDQPLPLAVGMDVYTISTNTWSSLPNVNPVTPRTDSCSAEVAGKVVMAGGYDRDYAYLSSLEEFNPATGSWRMLPAQLAIPRGDCAAVSLGGSMYIMGGVEPYTPPAGTPDFDSCEEDWNQCFLFSAANEVYNPVSGKITAKKPLLNARGDFGATVTNAGNILIAGGETQNRASGIWRETAHVWVAEYSPQDDVWSVKAPLPQPRFRFAMARAGDTIVAFGGHPTCPESECYRFGLDSTVIFSDAHLPDAFITLQD